MAKARPMDAPALEEFLTRGIVSVYPSRDFLHKKLLHGERVRLYLGVDPTGPTLHLGHTAVLLKLQELQKFGHEIILLIGDFTGMVGDPTDKSAARRRLTRADVLANAKKYKKQASRFLSFSGKNSVKLLHNSKWLSKLNFEQVLDLSAHFTVQQLMERDMFQVRHKEQKPIYLHEFLYPLLQGYDSVAMDVDGEIGGNDQTFNMLAGRTLMKQLKGKEKFVIAMKLLTDPSGKKMGKTEGNMVTFEDSPADMFGKIMSWPDEMIVSAFELLTKVSQSEIEVVQKGMAERSLNPRDAKARLALEIIKHFYSAGEAEKAQESFEKTFREGKAPDSISEIKIAKNTPLMFALAKRLGSNSRVRQRVQQGAISEIGGEKISDPLFPITRDMDLRIGSHEFVRLKIM